MGTKRPHTGEVGGRQGFENPRHSESAHQATKKKRKQARKPNVTPITDAEGSKTNFTKIRYRARSIRRLLDRDQGLPANVRNDMQRELAAHDEKLSERDLQLLRSKMISRYHMVRFFGTS
jgi:hypothetical protein